MANINLNALKKQKIAKLDSSSESLSDENNNELETNNSFNPKEELKDTKTFNKSKISLKDLNIKTKTKENTNNTNSNDIFTPEETKEDFDKKISISTIGIKLKDTKTTGEENKSEKKDTITNKIQESEIIEDKNKENSKVQVKQEEEKKEELSICDGDTDCKIITQKDDEIFGNYMGSYEEEIEEIPEPKEVKKQTKAKIEKVDIMDDISINNIKKEDENNNNNKKEIIDEKQKNTPLESFKEKSSKKPNKKIFISSSIITALSIFSITFLFTDLFNKEVDLKGNIQEQNEIVNNIETQEKTNIVDENYEHQSDEINIIDDKIDDVNINSNHNFDNINNYDTIEKTIEKFLLEKYKLK